MGSIDTFCKVVHDECRAQTLSRIVAMRSNQSSFFLPKFTLRRPATDEVGVGLLAAPAYSSMVSVSPPSSMLSNPSANPYLPLLLPDFELTSLGKGDGLVARLVPAPTLRARTIRSFIRMTGRKIGRRSGTKGDGCRTASEPSDGIGLYGSAGSGRDLVAMMMYCRRQRYAQATS